MITMATTRITANTIKQALEEARQSGRDAYRWDTQVKGFGVRCSPKGSVSYVIQKRTAFADGLPSRVTIARDIEVSEARVLATIELGKLADGENIFLRRANSVTKQKVTASAPTLSETFTTYHQERDDGSRYWTEVKRIYDLHIGPAIGMVPLTSVTKQDVKSVLAALSERPGTKRWAHIFLNAMFRQLVADDEYGLQANPMQRLKAPVPGEERDRVLNDTEIYEFTGACKRLGYPFGDWFMYSLLTAGRRDETSGCRFEEINWDERTWLIPKERTKGKKKSRLVHLNEPAMKILLDIMMPGGCPYVFSSNDKTPISGFGKAKIMLMALMSRPWLKKHELIRIAPTYVEQRELITVPHFTTHDLRRTCSGWLSRITSDPVIQTEIGHAEGKKLKRIYLRHYDYAQERREAVEAWGAHVVKLSQPQGVHGGDD
jgi:integrase